MEETKTTPTTETTPTTDPAGSGNGSTAGGTATDKQETKTVTLDEKQLAEREQRAAKAMIKSMGEQAGLDEAGVQKLLDDYKVRKDAEKTDAQRATERAEKAEAELTTLKNSNAVLAAGVNPEFSEFVAYQAAKGVTNTTDFPAALKAYLEANPKYLAASGAGAAQQPAGAGGYRQGGAAAVSADKAYLDDKYKYNPYYKK